MRKIASTPDWLILTAIKISLRMMVNLLKNNVKEYQRSILKRPQTLTPLMRSYPRLEECSTSTVPLVQAPKRWLPSPASALTKFSQPNTTSSLSYL